MAEWHKQRDARARRIAAGQRHTSGKLVPVESLPALLEAVLEPGDRVCLEGDNQKQAEALARALAQVDPAKVRHLHMVQSGVVLPEHLGVLKRASRGGWTIRTPARIARMLFGGKIELGAVTPISNFIRYFSAYFTGLAMSLSLIMTIGAQNALVQRQRLRGEHVWAVCLVCALSDSALAATGTLNASDVPPQRLGSVVLTCVMLNWLNPHVYLDTDVLLGSIASQFPGAQTSFALGAISTSVGFFFALGYGARWLRPVMAPRQRGGKSTWLSLRPWALRRFA